MKAISALEIQEPPIVDHQQEDNDDDDKEKLADHKVGHSFLWCCCDMRVAVIVFDCIMLFIFGLSFFLSFKFLIDYKGQQGATAVAMHVFTTCVALLTHALSFYGAVSYKTWPLLVNIVYLVVGHSKALILGAQVFKHAPDDGGVHLSPFLLFALPSIGIVLGLYPHIVLAYQIRSGIMTKERYHRYEKQCCCLHGEDRV